MASQIQLRRDTAANWTSANTVLAQGEFAIETDTGLAKVGNGTTAWTSLPYSDFNATFTAGRVIESDVDGNLKVSGTTAVELGYVKNVTSSIQTQLDGKQAIVAGVSDTEIGYLDGVTSAIQTQIDGRVARVNGTVTTASTSSTVVRNITLSTSDPSGGIDGDVWLKYTA
jgi:hypothetical protein